MIDADIDVPDAHLPAGSDAHLPAESDDRRVEAVRAVTRLSRLLERRAGDLSLAHYRVLAAVAAGDERASRVAARLALGRPTVSASVEALCARGLLARSGDTGDQRAVQLRLTPQGRAVLATVEGDMTAALDHLARRVGDPERVTETLVALGRAVDEELSEASRRRVAAAGPTR